MGDLGDKKSITLILLKPFPHHSRNITGDHSSLNTIPNNCVMKNSLELFDYGVCHLSMHTRFESCLVPIFLLGLFICCLVTDSQEDTVIPLSL